MAKRVNSGNQTITQLIENGIDKGADTAEEINRAVLDLPISVLESIGLVNTAIGVKKLQDFSIGAIYEVIHDLNHQIAEVAEELLEKQDDSA